MSSKFSLKTRLSMGVVLAVLVTTLAITTAALFLVKSNLKASIAQEQFSRLSAVADAVDQKFASRRVLIDVLARSMEQGSFTTSQGIQTYLERHAALGNQFETVSVLDKSGGLLANFNSLQYVGKLNVKDRAYFQDTLASRTGLISQPIRNRMNGNPQVVLTEPVFDSKGEVQYVIAALINLQEKNFLGELADVKFGQSGYLFIVNTDGIVIDHPDKARILKSANDGGGIDASFATAQTGFEGTVESTNSAGVHGLYAFKRIKQTNWILGAIYPVDEAFAPLEAINRKAWIGACVLALVAGMLTLVGVRRGLAPLTRLEEHMHAVIKAPHYVPSPQTFGNDEIGELARTFETLMHDRQMAQSDQAHSERRARLIADNMPVLISHLDLDFRYTYANAQYLEWFDLSVASPVGYTVAEVFGQAVFEGVKVQMQAAMAGQEIRFDLVNPIENSPRFLTLHYLPDRDADGKIVGIYGMVEDRTEQHIAKLRMEASEKRLRAVTDNLPVLISYVDTGERLRFMNATFQQWFGLDTEAVLKQPVEGLLEPQQYAWHRAQLHLALSGQRVVFDSESTAMGVTRNLHTVYVPDRQDDGRVSGVFTLSTDVTALKLVERNLDQLARRDDLTGLPNRRQFDEHLDAAVLRCQRSRLPMALVFLDIDFFKSINDSRGHAAGDAVLKVFAGRLAAHIRATDFVARLAGDEFVIIMEALHAPEDAGKLAKKLLAAIRQPADIEGVTTSISSSMGIAYHVDGKESPADLLARADRALYRAKAAGRDGYVLDVGQADPLATELAEA